MRPENRHTSIAPVTVVHVVETLSLCSRISRRGREAKGTTKRGNGVNNKIALNMMRFVTNKERSSRKGGFFRQPTPRNFERNRL